MGMSPSPTPLQTKAQSQDHHYGPRFFLGLTIAGVGSALLTTTFSLFHVDVFLRVYELPLSTYATGNVIFGIINTANDLVGSWMVDAAATNGGRSDWIGLAGCLFAVCFLTPFFAWTSNQGVHFVTSMSLHDTMYSFTAILLGSVVTDHHNMSDADRVKFMASGKVVNLVASFMVARIGLAVFEQNDMGTFQSFLLILALVVCGLFVTAQVLMDTHNKQARLGATEQQATKPRKKLKLRRVIIDFWNHGNFGAWIRMEMLLECQVTFVNAFLKTFFDRLVVDSGSGGVSNDTCDWILSIMNPMKQIMGILCYIPIRRIGYHKVYMWLFVANFALSLLCLLLASPSHPWISLGFLIIYSVVTGAVQSAGFHLAMSDMVLEMKHLHFLAGRRDEPSLAGLFMGANALLCKPMESLLPVVSAIFLDETSFSEEIMSQSAKRVLFYLLIIPPMVFSVIQMWAWKSYSLTPERTRQIRDELKEHKLLGTLNMT
jgi:Na+/melibiose symporter-like transporter